MHVYLMASQKASKQIKPLSGQIALVTGGARGVGRGVALQLAEAGATVYISGRKPDSTPRIPTLHDTVNEISSRGDKAVAVYCDHSKDDEVKELFERISKDENNRLDVLVNNAFSGATAMEKNVGKKFFECHPSFWDEINNVGLRNVYICSVLASRMMVPRQKGLIVNISSAAGVRYFFNVPYGVGKAAIDKMSADMAEELKAYKITVVSLWPGTVKTEKSYDWLRSGILSKLTKMPQAQIERMVEKGETPDFVGRGVACLASDYRMLKKTGCVLLTADLSNEYLFLDNNG
uniref:Dehydrogenase/reductase SDR family member 1 n=1 Tax=Loa loa TaxID=7209 RepID=A0A1I7VAJ8_LOALO